MILAKTLKADVVIIGKAAKKYSIITIKMGDILVARAVCGGSYNQSQALKEFRKNYKRFTPINEADLSSYAKVA